MILLISTIFILAVQHERGPRNSTLRRQMALYFNRDSNDSMMSHNNGPILDLAVPRPGLSPQHSPPIGTMHPSAFMCSPMTKVRVLFNT